jgi:hypothetical protein
VTVLFLLTYRIAVSVVTRSATRAGSRAGADRDPLPRGGERVDDLPGAARQATAIADVGVGGS